MAAPGLPTVFKPGLLCSARLYDSLLPTAWAYGAVPVADHRRDDTIGDMAARLLDDAPEGFVLVGLSMGGYVAHEVVRQAPERVSGLVLISTSARPDTAAQRESRQHQRQVVLIGGFDDLMARPDSRSGLAAVACPTAVIHGTGDRLVAPDNAVETASAIPGGGLTLVDRAGHMLPQEQPAAAHAALAALLDRVATATS